MIYNKRKINEDFDFGNIKKSNIEDDYTIDAPIILRNSLTKTVNIRNIVDPEILKIFEKYGKKKRYSYPNIGQYLGNILFNGGRHECIEDDLAQKLVDLGFDDYNEMGYEFDFSDDDYRLKLFDAVINVLTDGEIISCKDDGVAIQYYVSPDKGYIILNAMYLYNIHDESETLGGKTLMGQPIICFTGLVDYSKNTVNENHVFRKKNSFKRRF